MSDEGLKRGTHQHRGVIGRRCRGGSLNVPDRVEVTKKEQQAEIDTAFKDYNKQFGR